MTLTTTVSFDAISWWRHLLADLGTAPQTGDSGPLGDQAKRRCADVVELYFTCIAELGATLMLELGSYSAETSRRFVNADPRTRRAIACEASPRVHAGFADTHPESGGVSYINAAVGATEGTVTFNMPRDPHLVLWGSVAERANFDDVETCEVKMVTVDMLLARHDAYSSKRTTVCWIDVEGLALDVLKGAGKALTETIAAVYIEVYDIGPFSGRGRAFETIDLLLSKGFIPIARDNEYSDAWNLFAVHQDCFEAVRDTVIRWTYSQRKIAYG